MNAGVGALLALLSIASLPSAAASKRYDTLLGQWQFDASKSTFFGAIPYQSGWINFKAEKGGVHVVAQIVEAGRELQFEYIDPENGSFAPVTGNPFYDAESTVWIDSHNAVRTERRDGKRVGVTRITVAKDGSTYSARARRTLPNGRLYTSIIEWRRSP